MNKLYTGHVLCKKCGKFHWMYGNCKATKVEEKKDLNFSGIDSFFKNLIDKNNCKIYNIENFPFFDIGHSSTKGYMKMYIDFCWNAYNKYNKKDFVFEAYSLLDENQQPKGLAIIQNLLYRLENYSELSIYVDKNYRNQGIGQMLMNNIIENTKQKNISIWVDNNNNNNKKFFEKFQTKPFSLFDQIEYLNKHKIKPFVFDE